MRPLCEGCLPNLNLMSPTLLMGGGGTIQGTRSGGTLGRRVPTYVFLPTYKLREQPFAVSLCDVFSAIPEFRPHCRPLHLEILRSEIAAGYRRLRFFCDELPDRYSLGPLVINPLFTRLHYSATPSECSPRRYTHLPPPRSGGEKRLPASPCPMHNPGILLGGCSSAIDRIIQPERNDRAVDLAWNLL